VPQHNVYHVSNLVLGAVTVGVCPTLPFEGVSFILGNDLAGEKVVSNLYVINSADSNDEKIALKFTLYVLSQGPWPSMQTLR